MAARHFRILMSLLTVALMGALPVSVYAGKGSGTATPLTANIYNIMIDEQNTNAFWGGTEFCAGTPNSISFLNSGVTGDASFSNVFGPNTAYGFGSSSPWTTEGPPTSSGASLSSSAYLDGTDCSSDNNCLRVAFNSNNKVLTIDTRGTAHPSPPGPARTMSVRFTPCVTADLCPGANGTAFAGDTITEPMLMNVFLNSPYINMAVCSSTACPEAQEVFGKLWFADPADASQIWRLDWVTLRMLRMSSNTWYLIASDCDGTQVVGLSKLEGSRTRPRTVFNGYYKIPFFISLVR